MKRNIFAWIVFSLLSLCVVSVSIAATVHGNAYKDGQSDHSGITIDLETFAGVPALSVTGSCLVILAVSFFLLRKRIGKMPVFMVVSLVAGLSCITFAAMRATTVTNSMGQYFFANVDPGEYSLEASAPGYIPDAVAPLAITAGDNTVPDITLYLQPTPTPFPAGSLIATDPIVGNMRSAPAGTFIQGSPITEPCREYLGIDETQFTHILTHHSAMMETEVTRQMWLDLQALQTSLPVDPSDTYWSPNLSCPVQAVTWYEAVLFANLLSIQNGFTPCYYRDAIFTDPVDATNYINDDHYCNFYVGGYRLPAEGEWEYCCRAGTTTPFSCNETNYTSGNCTSCTPGTHQVLEAYCYFCANYSSPIHWSVVDSKLPNPWNLKDMHGNVAEWCWDWADTYPAGPVTDYTGPAMSSLGRVVRVLGGYPTQCRSAARFYFNPNDTSYTHGFRLVRTY
ncbi:SUMF1/EgtB/PvdO family nonheme iron enzyme [bacterium]|nr:SUMF1/EgtB/PvdO family nonheme iron enzyme [candidate division CSSED10-310 bacterium]